MRRNLDKNYRNGFISEFQGYLTLIIIFATHTGDRIFLFRRDYCTIETCNITAPVKLSSKIIYGCDHEKEKLF